MPHKEPSNWSWVLTMSYAAFAGFGGALGYIMRTLEAEKKISKWRIAIEGGAAAFAGVLVMLLCQAMNLGLQWTGVIVGVCGWLGASATIRMLEKVTIRKIGAEGEGNADVKRVEGPSGDGNIGPREQGPPLD